MDPLHQNDMSNSAIYELVVAVSNSEDFSQLEIENMISEALSEVSIVDPQIVSTEGEFSSYYYIDVDRERGEKLIHVIEKMQFVDGVYLKPKGDIANP